MSQLYCAARAQLHAELILNPPGNVERRLETTGFGSGALESTMAVVGNCILTKEMGCLWNQSAIFSDW
ncbi:hypothetical protein CEP54_006535 [Fusarium duplospermum]|uniref:Uncharacterized protein n=1 Tax=Fusarium duplospermum TaxID=1325734 RepID=A0A428Q6L8_9HYPO|nr:hypothetical protein CEP54_006535 [Fusarium duplospermum]